VSASKGHKRSTSRRDVGVQRRKLVHRQTVKFSPAPGVATGLLRQIKHDENSRSSNASSTRQRHDTPDRHLFTMRTAGTARRDTRGATSTCSKAIATLDQNRATRGTRTPQRRRCRQRAPSVVSLPPRSRPSSDEPHDCRRAAASESVHGLPPPGPQVALVLVESPRHAGESGHDAPAKHVRVRLLTAETACRRVRGDQTCVTTSNSPSRSSHCSRVVEHVPSRRATAHRLPDKCPKRKIASAERCRSTCPQVSREPTTRTIAAFHGVLMLFDAYRSGQRPTPGLPPPAVQRLQAFSTS
jgi:hypothetical protein